MAKKNTNTRTTENVEKKLVYIPITELHPHPDNPRKDLGDLAELAESIKVKGVMQNLTVVRGHYITDEEYKKLNAEYSENPTEEIRELLNCAAHHRPVDGGYTIIIGHRRMGASKLAGLTELPCVIVDMSPQEQVATMLLENMQRSDLTVYEQAQGFQMMFDFGESIDSIAEKTGFSKTTVSRRLKMAELNQDTLKKVSERQLSLTDFDRLSKIEDIEERNKVLAEIGTRNFENALTKALSDQKNKANMKRWREALTERGIIEIPADDKWNHDKYEMLPYATLSGEVDQLDEILQGDGPFYYCFDWGTLYLRKAKVVSAEDEAEKIRKAKKEDEERIKREGLSAAFERAYELRFNFVKGVSETTAKKHFPDIVRFLVELGCYFYAEFDWAMFAELTGVEVDEDEYDEDVVWEALKPSVDNRTYYATLAYAYSISNDSANMKCYSWRFEFENNSTLNTIYAFLEKLGYEMSDEECELLNGESDLYIKPESSMENKKDEDNEEEIIEAELIEDEDPADEDETSDEDAERDELLAKLRAEYGGDTDDE